MEELGDVTLSSSSCSIYSLDNNKLLQKYFFSLFLSVIATEGMTFLHTSVQRESQLKPVIRKK